MRRTASSARVSRLSVSYDYGFALYSAHCRSRHLRCSLKFRKRSATLLKKTLWHRCFPVNYAKFLRTCFLQNQLQNTSRRLLLYLPPITATTVNVSDVCISFKFKRFQRIWFWYLIFITLSLVLLFFWCFFCLSQFCFIFSCRCQ